MVRPAGAVTRGKPFWENGAVNKRFDGTIRVAFRGLALAGLAGAFLLQIHGAALLRTAGLPSAPAPEQPALLASAAGNAALAGVLAGSLAPAQLTCADIRLDLSISPNPVAPGGRFQLLTRAYRQADGVPVRIERARYYYIRETMQAYRDWQRDPVANAKPQPNLTATNQTPAPTVADLPIVTGSIADGGDYDIVVEAVIVMSDGSQQVCVLDLAEEINVAEPPAATLDIQEYIIDSAGLVPLNDWVPLFGFNIKWSGDEPAPRALTRLSFQLRGDPIATNVRNYRNWLSPEESDYLVFSLIPVYVRDGGLPGDVGIGLYDLPDGSIRYGNPVMQWDSHGWPYDMPTGTNNGQVTYSYNDNSYNLSFIYDSTDNNFPVSERNNFFGLTSPGPFRPFNEWIVSGPGDGYSYIVAVRLSSAWQTSKTLSVAVTNACMQPYYLDLISGQRRLLPVPTNDSGLLDSYTPNFFEGEILAPEEAYSASFGVFDIRGNSPSRNYNAWNDQVAIYTPLAQFTRPRWDLPTNLIQTLTGEMLEIRKLFSVEAWEPVLGIDAHGAPVANSVLFDFPEINTISVVMTDVGADPFSPPGNGGFDPREGLGHFTAVGLVNPNYAAGEDYAFNGLWMWHDTNGNGVFDPPVPSGAVGVSFVDYPMYPLLPSAMGETQPITPGIMQWNYEPFPPGGGDPWWTIDLGFYGGRRRAATDTPTGALDPTPDSWGSGSDYAPIIDYFLVMRTDSGFRDVSGNEGDGVGVNLGADTRAFVMPRRWNPKEGYSRWDGGMLMNIQARTLGNHFDGVDLDFTDYDRYGLSQFLGAMRMHQMSQAWDIVCDSTDFPCSYETKREYPWWPERTHSQDTVKPFRGGAEVRDLTLTYSTDNKWAKITPIMAGQSLDAYNFFPDILDTTLDSRSAIGLWTDPSFLNPGLINVPGYEYYTGASINSDPYRIWSYYGIRELRFFNRHNPIMVPDYIDSWRGAGQWATTQYAFETVPFRLEGDGLDELLTEPRSSYWPNPPAQPNLPRYTTWPGYEGGRALINWGDTGRCYLATEGALPNPPYTLPTSSGAEAAYADDVYVFVADNPKLGPLPSDLAGKWLVDNYGGRYRIESSAGAALTLRRGHGAYLDRRQGSGNLSVAKYPYQVPVGPAGAVERGRWMIVEDTLPRGTYPRLEDWQPDRLLNPDNAWAARLLKQYIEPDSLPTAMLGINLAGTSDPVVNQGTPLALNSVAVAFWGPEFDPSQLAGLDPNGALYASGVVLYEDSNQNGVFDGPIITSEIPIPSFRDAIVPLEQLSLEWPESPEPIDLYGDFQPDDLSGDGVVFLGDPKSPADVAALTPEELDRWDGFADLAWVLEMRPRAKWNLPRTDGLSSFGGLGKDDSAGNWPDYWLDGPRMLDYLAGDGAKALDPAGANPGDDLFIVVRTSPEAKAFSEFRAMIPAKLPTRAPESRTIGGIQVTPRAYNVVDTATKHNSEESPIQDYYGHDMMPVGVRTVVTDMAPATIQPGALEVAVLGVDASVNRPDHLAASGAGAGAQVTADTFTPTDADVTAPADSVYYRRGTGWTDAAVGLYLIGMSQGDINNARLEGYEITAVNGRRLTLRAGAPRADRKWFVVKDPTFLEQMVVEFYDVDNAGTFDLQSDLLPLNHEDPFNGVYSGVALYRDNDLHPSNRNGVFDPPIRNSQGQVLEYIDLPVRLDNPPILLGTVGGEPEYQVKFSFAAPGTDNLVGRDQTAYAGQPRNRQWVPQTAGMSQTDPNFGPEFFVVVRPSNKMSLNDRFQAAIVSWGPNTPTEPDPDNFTVTLAPGQIPGQPSDAFDLFSEFPWGSRGVGYITLFQEKRPIYYTGFDKDKMRAVPRQDEDRSQDGPDFAALRNWIRTNPPVAVRTKTVTSLAPPQLDFTGVPTRQRVNADVAFTLIGATQVASVEWSFGDGNTSTQINPVHQYAAQGVYTVEVTVVNQFGIKNTVRKAAYITILATPYADFSATPLSGAITAGLPSPALAVTFSDLSVGDDCMVAESWAWNFGDGQTSAERNPVHRYTLPGIYSVTLEVTFRDNCNGGSVVRTFRRDNYITVLPGTVEGEGEGEGEGEPTENPAADISFSTLIPDKEAVMPLSDWVPLFRFTMSYGEEDFAPRKLSSLQYWIRLDDRDNDELGYINMGAPYPTDLLEFGLFQEGFSDGADADKYGILDSDYDRLLFKWDNLGAPAGEITGVQQYSGIVYEMDFIGDGTPARPQFDVPAGRVIPDVRPDGNVYIVAVRTSATWRSMLTMGVEVLSALMIDPRTGTFPTDEEGAPVDSYSPNFFDGESLEDKQFYSSAFTVFDYVGTPTGTNNPRFSDAWSYPHFLYTPLAEHSRPRWNKAEQLLDVVAGEFIQVRELVGLDSWTSVLGINAHSTKPVHFAEDTDVPRVMSAKDAIQLREVNVIITDIGADPYGPPGNGGFDPRTGLETMTDNTWGLPIFNEEVFSRELTFNGVWVWHDTNNNGVFDAPTGNPGGGLTFNGDYPMLPSSLLIGELMPTWDYIPLPPGGGDPWWKISLRLWGGTRKLGNYGSYDKEFTEGFVEKVPDNHTGYTYGSEESPDYFVVVRTDSGFKDISLAPGDGAGITYGADFRAFIEPRRFDPTTGNQTGGIFLDSMIPAQGLWSGSDLTEPWQNDVRWLEYEPWWPQRTFNASTAKPMRVGVDVSDLVMTYESDSEYRYQTDLFYTVALDSSTLGGTTGDDDLTIGGYSDIGVGALSGFDQWLDPFGMEQIKFLNGHTVEVASWRLYGQRNVDFGVFALNFLFDDTRSRGQFAYETVPFFSPLSTLGDAPPVGPRSSAYPVPPEQPMLPWYANWSAALQPGEYPRASQWRPEDAKARLLAQKVDANSAHTAMLGVNLVASSDPVVVSSGEPIAMSQICVAFWGPGFTPSMLKPLDPERNDNQSLDSGVLLWEDADANGVLVNSQELNGYSGTATPLPLFDRVVPVTGLSWRSQPELVDINGDGRADDMNGDGIVDDTDRAWVLTMYPKTNWVVPQQDGYEFEIPLPTGKSLGGGVDRPGNALEINDYVNAAGAAKALDAAVVQPGHDLFISVSTSDELPRFQQFRAVIPATLPARPENQRKAGIQFFPQINTSGTAFVKNNPDEDPVQDFFGHDMIEANVPARLVDLTNRNATLNIGGAAVSVLGLDLATNRPNGTLVTGAGGVGLNAGFRVPGAAWAPGAYAGDWLVDSGYETYEIVANTANELVLLSGAPRNGAWRIVRDPSFLEEVTVELYQDGIGASFNPVTDLLPLDIDQRLSGVALYRDNDQHPDNRNAYFDPDIDIPITLDAVPRFVGQSGEDIQVKFVFSTPGTDDFPKPRAEQTRNRQWVQDSFGASVSDVNYGSDFFVVVRPSQQMQVGDTLRAGIVSWGPNTPTEPDPDTWAALPGEDRNDFVKFREFPWAERGIGFITFFKNPDQRYFMDGAKAGVRADNSGFKWVRSHSAKKRLSGIIQARTRPVGPTTLALESVSQNQLPSQTLPGEPFRFVIYGNNFGASPVVVMSGYDVVVTGATNTAISVSVSTRADSPPVEPVVLLVRNPVTGDEVSRSDLFDLVPGTPDRKPKVLRVDPARGERKDFPVRVLGENLGGAGTSEVSFGKTIMPVLDASADGTSLTVGFPAGGMAATGKMDVRVRNTSKSSEDILVKGFEYVNDSARNKFLGALGCAPVRGGGSPWGDALVLAAALGALALARRRGARARG